MNTGFQLLEEAIVARDVALAFAQTSNLDTALLRMLQRMCQAWNWRLAQAWFPSEDGRRLVAGPLWSDPDTSIGTLLSAHRDLVFARGQGLPGTAWSLQQPVLVSGATLDTLDPRRPALRAAGLKSSLAMPLLAGDEVLSVLEFFADEQDETSADVVDLMEVVARRLAPVIARRSTDDSIRVSEERLRCFAEGVNEAIVSFDSKGSLMFANASAQTLLGSGEELVGRPISFILPEPFASLSAERMERYVHHFGSALSRHARVPLVLRARAHDVAVEVSLTRHGTEGRLGYTALIREIAVDVASTEAWTLSRALQMERKTNRRLRTSNEMKDTMLCAVSHELMDPLMALRGLTSLLTKDASGELTLTAERRHAISGQLHSAGLNMRKILIDLLDMKRLEQGIVEPKRRPTSLLELIRGVVERSAHLSDRIVSVGGSDIILPVDRTQVETIVSNLVKNAAQHSPAGSEIIVTLEWEPGGATLSVVDHGPGVPISERRAIFLPFRRGPNHGCGGLGIGLSLVEGFARLHGGRAWVDDAKGGGAALHVFLAEPDTMAPHGVDGCHSSPFEEPAGIG